ncbi:unnamed protein product, partial [Meganyctiphanes norvegica]
MVAEADMIEESNYKHYMYSTEVQYKIRSHCFLGDGFDFGYFKSAIHHTSAVKPDSTHDSGCHGATGIYLLEEKLYEIISKFFLRIEGVNSVMIRCGTLILSELLVDFDEVTCSRHIFLTFNKNNVQFCNVNGYNDKNKHIIIKYSRFPVIPKLPPIKSTIMEIIHFERTHNFLQNYTNQGCLTQLVAMCLHQNKYAFVNVSAMPSLKYEVYGLCDTFTGNITLMPPKYRARNTSFQTNSTVFAESWKTLYAIFKGTGDVYRTSYCTMGYRLESRIPQLYFDYLSFSLTIFLLILHEDYLKVKFDISDILLVLLVGVNVVEEVVRMETGSLTEGFGTLRSLVLVKQGNVTFADTFSARFVTIEGYFEVIQ